MNVELGGELRIAGLIRSPDREGAIAHLDADRGFALTARASLSVTDVIDPTIWVKEKISVALGTSGEDGEPPLRRLIGSLRSIHAELMHRPERDRPWVSVLALLFQGGDGVLISAGDCPCYRYRDGILAHLRRPGETAGGASVPRGALGSEPQVRIEVVPLRPEAGDVYVASTRPLREGELQALASALAAARDGAQLLRAGIEGASDRGRLAVRVLVGDEDGTLAGRAEAMPEAPSAEPIDAGSGAEAAEPIDVEPLAPLLTPSFEPREAGGTGEESERFSGLPGALDRTDTAAADARPEELLDAPDAGEAAVLSFDDLPDEPIADATYGASLVEERREALEPAGEADAAPAAVEGPERFEAAEVPAEPTADTGVEAPRDAAAPGPEPDASAAAARPRELATIEEERPWYEPLALWGGGALAIIALALLLRAILPGILGTRDAKDRAAVTAPTHGTVDFLSDPPGALVRVDGEPLDGRTPLAAVSLDPGIHRIELDWGASGTWRDTLEVAAGSRLVLHPAIYGSAEFASADPARVLDVTVDGAYAGTTPLTIDKLVVGRHLVRFGGPGQTTTAQEIDVLRDTPVELIGNPGPIPEKGKLTVRSAILTDTGFQPGKNDPVWIDGTARGATPLTMDLTPGTHSVRVVRRDFPAQVTVLEVKSGGEHFVNAEFGAESTPPIAIDPPSAISIANPPPITISLPAEEWDPTTAVWLYAASPGGSFQARRMTQLEDGERTFAGLLPVEVLRNAAKKVRFYVKATADSGREFYSEIYTVPVGD